MKNGWRIVPLGQLVTFKTGKLDSNAAVVDGVYPFFTCSQETLRTNTYSFDDECVLLAGNNANGIYALKYFHGKFDAYQRTYVIRTRDRQVLTTKFLYYALRPKLAEFRAVSTGAATRFLTLGILNETAINVPPASVQRRITDVLSAYDELIENCERRIRILKEMARALYREWFVDFRFPSHENIPRVDSAVGPIPKGWLVTKLGEELAALESGKRPKGGIRDVTDGVPSIGAENINGIANHDFANEKFVPREFFKAMNKGVVRDGDVAIYKDGAYIGRSSYFRDGFPHVECCVNEHVFLLRTTGERLTQNALYLWLQEPDAVQTMRATNANAAQPGLNQQGINGIELIVPDAVTAASFNKFVDPLFAAIINHAKRIQNLRRTRDLLLPRLLSRQIVVAVAGKEQAAA